MATAAAWQSDPEAAQAQAVVWVDSVAKAKSWDDDSYDSALATIQAAMDDALSGSWLETDNTTTIEFWEALYSRWGTDWPNGGSKLLNVWAMAAQASGSASVTASPSDAALDSIKDLGIMLDDLLPGEQDPDRDDSGMDTGTLFLLLLALGLAWKVSR